MTISVNKSLLAQANKAYRDKEFTLAFYLYSNFICDNPSLESLISFNLAQCKAKLGLSEVISPSWSDAGDRDNAYLNGQPFCSFSSADNELMRLLADHELSPTTYCAANNISVIEIPPLIHYLLNWRKIDLIIPDFFDCRLYRFIYPDILQYSGSPLAHFMKFGKAEGRIGNAMQLLRAGSQVYSSTKETIIFVSHESSATGAPLLGYNIINEMSAKYNVVHIVIREANIGAIIPNNCFLYACDIHDSPEHKSLAILSYLLRKFEIKSLLLNSVETLAVLLSATRLKIPTVSLVHEFSDYTRPVGKMVDTLYHATRVITPASIITKSILEELNSHSSIDTPVSHITQIPQGKLPFLPNLHGSISSRQEIYEMLNIEANSEVKILVGAGYVQIRKGVDVFLSVARYVKQKYEGNVKFIWVGDGYNPVNDYSCSIWLQRDLKVYELVNDFIFLKHQKSLDTVFEIADIFCLTSRMDPFPNVAIDAMEFDLPIACFEDASGTEEFLKNNNADYLTAKYLDAHDMADQIVAYLDKHNAKSKINSEIVANVLDFGKYIHAIDDVVIDAQERNMQCLAAARTILQHSMIDAHYSGLALDSETAAYFYCMLHMKGLHKLMLNNPRPGFSQLKWILENGYFPHLTPLEHAIQQNKTETHRCILTPTRFADIAGVDFKYAVHLHLFYPDLAHEFSNYLSNLPGIYDLFVTTTSQENRDLIGSAFKACGASNVEVLVAKNIGRDMGPMIFDLHSELLCGEYEVIGHFHGKKSLSTDNNMGDRWRKYLMQNLCGSREIANSVLSLFHDDKVGLIFAEDKHIVDIGMNRKFLSQLSSWLGLSLIEDTHVFPLGNMFWARLSAIQDIFHLSPADILQSEPLPYDGSFLHALERLTPYIAMKNGYEYITVYDKISDW
jgi:hypothetical protein